MTADEAAIGKRTAEKAEMDAVGEEQAAEIKEAGEKDAASRENLLSLIEEANPGRVEVIALSTNNALETTKKDLGNLFAPKVILVNHEKRLGVDTTCANLAIKFNMIYISVYQILK